MTAPESVHVDPDACPHGSGKPVLCRECRALPGPWVDPRPFSAHSDPDIQAAWREARDGLAHMLRGWVVAHKVDELAQLYVDDLEARGWRPPLRPPRAAPPPADPAAVTARGAELARAALTRNQEDL